MMSGIEFSTEPVPDSQEIAALYLANGWSSGQKPDLVRKALENSDGLVLARHRGQLIGLVYALSDGHLVVYYPHLIVHPDYQGKGVGKALMERIMQRYGDIHQQVLIADDHAEPFYRKLGFTFADGTKPMWIYDRAADGAG
ncbi:GNAT family N-acetyltransferase [Hwanghaeella grinnelliae]|nr:GNAT family N-acetyltransferase [Hwanghaeella grinnelliae]